MNVTNLCRGCKDTGRIEILPSRYIPCPICRDDEIEHREVLDEAWLEELAKEIMLAACSQVSSVGEAINRVKHLLRLHLSKHR